MKPKDREPRSQEELFRSRLEQMIDLGHELCQLANQIDWERFIKEFGQLYVEKTGRPGLPIRLLVGLHYLKHLYGESDESVVAKYLENPYWQYFCGNEYFEHSLPCDPTSLVKWRHRVKWEGIEKLFQESIQVAQRSGHLKEEEIKRVNVDTTVQEKAISFPTDARLYQKARTLLVKQAVKEGIKLRQSYQRLGKIALVKQGRYAHAKQMRRARREMRKLRTWLGRVIRDIERKSEARSPRLRKLLELSYRLYKQKRDDKGKLYSLHAPEVECIGKGKAHKAYEFGCKVSVVTTSKQSWVVGIEALPGNPYDGSTLKGALEQVERVASIRPKEAFVDRGYRGSQHHPDDVAVYVSGRRGLRGVLKKALRRRAAIEPMIGHMKQDHGMLRNYLLGQEGDKINALLSGCGMNLRKLLRAFFLRIFGIDILGEETPISRVPDYVGF
jgi:IS5 family transposase